MIDTPDRDDDYHFPVRYNKYLIEEFEKNGLKAPTNLYNMVEQGRHNGEIMRGHIEYISCLKYEVRFMKLEVLLLNKLSLSLHNE